MGVIIAEVKSSPYARKDLNRMMSEALYWFNYFKADVNVWVAEDVPCTTHAVDLKQTLSNMELFDVEVKYDNVLIE